MIPLRKVLIVQKSELVFPEGVACAKVLQAGQSESSSGMKTILYGSLLGFIFKLMSSGINTIKATVETAFFANGKVWYVGSDVSPALLAVGYIVKLEIAFLMLLGGLIAWLFVIPSLGMPTDGSTMPEALDYAWTLWSKKARYVGVGAMVVGGLWSIISFRRGISSGISELKSSYRQKDGQKDQSQIDMSFTSIFVLFLICVAVIFGLYRYIIGSWGLSILTTVIMVVASFIFVAVSSYTVGLVGSSNNPVSGITISALLGSSALFLVFGFSGQSAILSTLGVASIVCCAACTAGDCSQDLKTGALISASPRNQQIAEIIGVVIPAFVIAPVLTLLHSAYGIGDKLAAPQASLFASLANAIFGDGTLPVNMVLIGVALGVFIIILDQVFIAKKIPFRLYLMPIAVGIYLPVTLAIPIIIGGVIRYLVDRQREITVESQDHGVFFGSGLIAGEAITGVLLAFFAVMKLDLSLGLGSNYQFALTGSMSVLLIVLYYKLAFGRR